MCKRMQINVLASDVGFEAAVAVLLCTVECIRLTTIIDANVGNVVSGGTLNFRVLDLELF